MERSERESDLLKLSQSIKGRPWSTELTQFIYLKRLHLKGDAVTAVWTVKLQILIYSGTFGHGKFLMSKDIMKYKLLIGVQIGADILENNVSVPRPHL